MKSIMSNVETQKVNLLSFFMADLGEERVNFLEDFLIQKNTELSYLIKEDVATVNHMRVWKITPLGI